MVCLTGWVLKCSIYVGPVIVVAKNVMDFFLNIKKSESEILKMFYYIATSFHLKINMIENNLGRRATYQITEQFTQLWTIISTWSYIPSADVLTLVSQYYISM